MAYYNSIYVYMGLNIIDMTIKEIVEECGIPTEVASSIISGTVQDMITGLELIYNKVPDKSKYYMLLYYLYMYT